MQTKRLVFKPIDLDAHAPVCVAFRRDSFKCSFGEDGFFKEAGPDGVHYIERLRLRTTEFRDGYVHAWHGDKIVGQMEMQILEEPRPEATHSAQNPAHLQQIYAECAEPSTNLYVKAQLFRNRASQYQLKVECLLV